MNREIADTESHASRAGENAQAPHVPSELVTHVRTASDAKPDADASDAFANAFKRHLDAPRSGPLPKPSLRGLHMPIPELDEEVITREHDLEALEGGAVPPLGAPPVGTPRGETGLPVDGRAVRASRAREALSSGEWDDMPTSMVARFDPDQTTSPTRQINTADISRIADEHEAVFSAVTVKSTSARSFPPPVFDDPADVRGWNNSEMPPPSERFVIEQSTPNDAAAEAQALTQEKLAKVLFAAFVFSVLMAIYAWTR